MTDDIARNYYNAFNCALIKVSRHYGLNFSKERARNLIELNLYMSKNDKLLQMADYAEMSMTFVDINAVVINPWNLPIIVESHTGFFYVVDRLTNEDELFLINAESDQDNFLISIDQLKGGFNRAIILKPLKGKPDIRVDSYIRPPKKSWIVDAVFKKKKPYIHILIASFAINLLGLAGITYSMQAYDRIIPAQSYPTMLVLFLGVIIAFGIDYVLKMARYTIIDLIGRQADLKISDRVFGHSIRIKNHFRPKSTGTFISQVKELEQVREMITSTTIVTIADLPFFFLFVFVIYCLSGYLCLIPIAGLFIMILPGILSQKKLYKLANTSTREYSLRNAMLVESIQGMDDIKMLQAEAAYQNIWNRFTDTTSQSSLDTRHLIHKLMTWSYTVQNFVFVAVIVAGTPLVILGELTTGALVASSILSSRMMGPISQISNLIARWQQTKVAMAGLNTLMDLPTDSSALESKIHAPILRGNYALKNATIKHHISDNDASLSIKDLLISPGEKIAILGPNGSGKSTLLKALSGGAYCYAGQISLDGMNLTDIDYSDLRKNIFLISQDSKLFYGTIRENMLFGAPSASDIEILDAIKMAGAFDLISKTRNGLDYLIQEGGEGMSGGERKTLIIARMMLKKPSIVIMDEPTSSLDELIERRLIQSLESWVGQKTLIIATHRLPLLELVDRIIVLDDGGIVLDGTKQNVLAELGL